MYMEQGIVPLGHMVPVPHNGSTARITLSWWLMPKVRSILAADSFDVIHVHEPSCPLLPWLFLWQSNSINVGTFHFYGEKSVRYRMASPTLVRSVCSKLHGRTAVSIPAMECANKYAPGDYRLIPNGIDLKHFSNHAAPIEELCDGKTNILFVGRLEGRKGASYLLKAYEQVKQEVPNSRLIMVGSGNRQRRAYEEEIKDKKIKDVIFTGYISDSELPRYYRSADVFCAPAVGKESFGIVLLEAMAAGKPIVASDIGGYSRLIDHGAEGLLVPPKDSIELAQSLVHLLKDEDLRLRMGASGRKKAENYSWESIADQTLNYYLELLDGRRGGVQ